jgi:hypothetical protein
MRYCTIRIFTINAIGLAVDSSQRSRRRKMGTVKWFSGVMIGLALGVGGTFGVQATAASGDAIYETRSGEVEIQASDAACVATCLINAGVWTGAANDLIKGGAYRTTATATGFAGKASGLKSAPLSEVPERSVIHGVKE